MISSKFKYFLLGGILATAGGMLINLMPLTIGLTAEEFSLTSSQLGMLASGLLSGSFLATVSSFWWIGKVNWRITTIISSIAVFIFLFSGTYISSYQTLLITWTFAGAFTAICYCIAIRFLSESSNPEQAFGLKLALEIAIPGLLLVIIPLLIFPFAGFKGAIIAIGIVIVICGIFGIRLPKGPKSVDQFSSQPIPPNVIPILLGLLAIAVYFAGATAMWAFLERIGNDSNISPQSVGVSLSLAKFVGVASALLVTQLEDRLGHRTPHYLALAIMVVAIILFTRELDFFRYAFATALFEFAWTVAAIYQIAQISRMDHSKRLVVLTPAALTLGGVFGPAFAGSIIDTADYTNLFIMVGVTTLVSTIAFTQIANIKKYAN